MIRLLHFAGENSVPDESISDISPGEIPDEMNIFFRDIDSFIPEGKTFDELTDDEKSKVQNRYRFDPLRPGIYQGITGFGNMI